MSAIDPLKVTVVFTGDRSSGEIKDGKIVKNGGVKCESFREFILHGNKTLNSNPSGYHYSQIVFYCNDQPIIWYDSLTKESSEFRYAQGTDKIKIADRIVRSKFPPVLPSTTTSTEEQVDLTQEQVDSTQEQVDLTQEQVDSTEEQVDTTEELEVKLISLISLLDSMSLDSINEMEEQNNVDISKKLSLLAFKFLKQ